MPAGSIIRRRLAVVLTLSAFVLSGTSIAAPPASATTRSEEKMWRAINAARDRYDRAPLKLVQSLSDKARAHSREMRDRGTIFHSNLAYVVRNYRWRVAGENVGMGPSIKSLHRAFMASPPHRANVLYRGYNRVGVGVAWKNGIAFVTVIFLG